MLTEVQVYNAQGSLLSIPLGDVTQGVFVKEVEGLDPVKTTIVKTKLASMPGTKKQASSREDRNIVIKLGIEPDYINEDPRDVRSRLYNYFMPDSSVDLRFVMDDSTAYNTSGTVESFESPIFTQEPGADISIICFDPDFLRSTDDQYADVEYHNLSSVSSSLTTTINNPGNLKTGIFLSFTPTRAVTSFSLYNTPEGGGVQQMDFNIPMLAYDTLQVSTVPGDKKVDLYRASALVGSMLYGVSPQSDWIELGPGDNEFRLYTTGSSLFYFVANYIRYGGL